MAARRVFACVALVLLAGCGDGGDTGAEAERESGSDRGVGRCDFVDRVDVEAAFGGSAEAARVPEDSPPGTCIFELENIDAGGDGQVAVVPLEDGAEADEAFDLYCRIDEAEEVAGVGDRACYAEPFQELYVLAGDRVLFLRAPLGDLFTDADPAQLRDSFLELGTTVAATV